MKSVEQSPRAGLGRKLTDPHPRLDLGRQALDARMVAERGAQTITDFGPHPGPRLVAAAPREIAALGKGGAEAFHGLPHGPDPVAFDGGTLHDPRRPGRAPASQYFQRRPVVAGDAPGRLGQIAIALGDYDEIGQLDDPLFQTLDVVAGAGGEKKHEQIDHVGDRGFRLSHPDRLHEQNVVSGRLAGDHGLARAPGHAPQGVTRRRGADEGVGTGREPAHPRLVGEQGSTAPFARRIDGEHGNPVFGADDVQAEGLDESGFAYSRSSRDADSDHLPTVWEQMRQQLLGPFPVIGPGRFDQGDRSRERPGVTRDDPAFERFVRQGAPFVRAASRRLALAREEANDFGGGVGNFRPRPEDRGDTRRT